MIAAQQHRAEITRPRRMQRWYFVWCRDCTYRHRCASPSVAAHYAELHQQGTPDGDAA